MPNSATTMKSKQKIADAMKYLLNKKNLNEISISDLTRRAKLSRPTYYSLFKSKEEVLYYIIQCYSEDLIKRYKSIDTKDGLLVIKTTVDFYIEFSEFSKYIYNNGVEYIISETRINLMKELSTINKLMGDDSHRFPMYFLNSGVELTVNQWLYEKKPITKEELVKMIYKFVTGAYFIV